MGLAIDGRTFGAETTADEEEPSMDELFTAAPSVLKYLRTRVPWNQLIHGRAFGAEKNSADEAVME